MFESEHCILQAYSFQELANYILFDKKKTKCMVKVSDFLVSPPSERDLCYEQCLSRQVIVCCMLLVRMKKMNHIYLKSLGRYQQVHLTRYRELCPEKKFYSLSQNPLVVKRTEDKHSYMMMMFTTAMDLRFLACKQY